MTIYSVLKQYFGYDSFRSGQEQLINDIVAGKDVLGIMPTGAGKSVCFQVPALMADSITLIISPLISLMKDQVTALRQSGVKAAYINSSLTERQTFMALTDAKNGAFKLIYVAPERLLTPDFLAFAKYADISMLVVDEAHCISQWGQDFRPSYAKIPEFIETLQTRPVVSAFTATATQKVREDIINLLELRDPTVLVTGFDRKNLYFEVQKPLQKFAALTEFLLDKTDKSGIVYCSTRKTVEEVCEKLNENGYSAARYHAGLSDKERNRNQEDFLYDRVKVMVATNAFGMGIDKSNVSFVVHYNMPKDIESYYQEAGRAGRDGEPADCILLYNGQDVRTNLWLIENSRDIEYPDEETEQLLKEGERKRLKEMTFYCTINTCLRSYILKYFGEDPPNYCGNCNNCNANYETADITIDAQKILSCVARMKEKFGVGMIVDVLRGSKSEKVLRFGFDRLTTYGIYNESEKRLREIINHLVLNGYLVKTDDQYPVIKLGERAMGVLRGGEKVEMKLAAEEDTIKFKKQEQAVQTAVRPVDKGLFAVLRELRKQIADVQSVPAFVVFSDSTLTDMCMKIPKNQEEMLEVSGVGTVKCERYGERFLDAIADYISSKPEEPETQEAQETQETQRKYDPSEVEITDTSEMISVIADRINCILIQYGYVKISAKRINDWLVSKGHMEIVEENGKRMKKPTETGAEMGITSEERIVRGENARINFYGKRAQEYIAENILEVIGDK